jgi:chemotaxis family two-component system response regulator Rcp1
MHATRIHRPIEILLAEDNPGDVRLTQEAFKEGRILNQLHVVSDGMEALAFLRQEGEYRQSPRPDLILLDLNMPRMNGRELLGVIKQDESLRRIPVIILTTSDAEEDIARSYDMHANCYVSKPVDFERFIQVVRSIQDFWLAVVTLPHE